MTTAEVETLLRLLAELERKELALLILGRREGGCISWPED